MNTSQKEVLIYQVQKSSTQSGTHKSSIWKIDFTNYNEQESQYIFKLMNWIGGKDTLKTINLRFNSKEEAINFATKNGLNYKVISYNRRSIKPKSYADNFS